MRKVQLTHFTRGSRTWLYTRIISRFRKDSLADGTLPGHFAKAPQGSLMGSYGWEPLLLRTDTVPPETYLSILHLQALINVSVLTYTWASCPTRMDPGCATGVTEEMLWPRGPFMKTHRTPFDWASASGKAVILLRSQFLFTFRLLGSPYYTDLQAHSGCWKAHGQRPGPPLSPGWSCTACVLWTDLVFIFCPCLPPSLLCSFPTIMLLNN